VRSRVGGGAVTVRAAARKVPLAVWAASAAFVFVAVVAGSSLSPVTPLDRSTVPERGLLPPVPPPPAEVARLGWPQQPGAVEVVPGGEVTLSGGDVELSGVVSFPDGVPAPGAVVAATRFVGDAEGTLLVVADESGRWRLPDLPGGRWRTVAWSPPSHQRGLPSVQFVEAGAAVEVPLRTGPALIPNLDVSSAVDADSVTVQVRVRADVVTSDGRVVPDLSTAGEASVSWPAGWDGPGEMAVTFGVATVTGRCRAPFTLSGSADVTVRYAGGEAAMSIPGCVLLSPTSTAPATSTTTLPTPSTTTSTTLPSGGDDR
jgi:hypothetical protein